MSTHAMNQNVGVTAAVVWVVFWALAFVAIGFNHRLTRDPDTLRVFVVAGVLAAFPASLWYVSADTHASVARVLNVMALGAILLAAVVVSRNPALMAVRWSSGQHSVMLVTSWVWVALIWLSISCAAGVAEVHHVLHSRAR